MNLTSKTWLRWLSWFLFASLFAAACVGLASWQFDRRDQAVSKIQRLVDNYERPAISLDSISSLPLVDVTSFEWTPVELTGTYLTSQELLVRNRPIAGQPGFIQLIPFQLASGEIVIVERGWIPANSELEPATSMTPSEEPKTLNARVRLSELTPNRDSPDGFATSIHLESLENTLGVPLEKEFYLRVISENPSEVNSPQPLSKPTLDEGNHLSYAVQWILFALMGFCALFWAIRQEQEYRRIDKDPTFVPRAQRNRKRTDGDIEDELLDVRN